jgi:trans-aconitate 2-methyltransferase
MHKMQGDWDPGQYERFAAERAQPFWDLVALVEAQTEPGSARRAHDLGCGTGELTAQLAARLGIAEMTGSDSSPAMLARAREHERPGLRFDEQDLARWTSAGDHDLVFANASLQWVPDHQGVLTRWWAALRPGGHLAVQVPANADHASHRVAAAVAAGEPFRSAMGGTIPPDPVAANVLAPEQYAVLLDHLGAEAQHVRLQVYGHVLGSTADVVEWVRGTSLTRIFKVLPAALHEQYVDAYRRRLVDELGDRSPYFYPFKRILLWARK